MRLTHWGLNKITRNLYSTLKSYFLRWVIGMLLSVRLFLCSLLLSSHCFRPFLISNHLHCLHSYGLMQERRNCSALAMESRLSCTNPSIFKLHVSCPGYEVFMPFSTLRSVDWHRMSWVYSRKISMSQSTSRYVMWLAMLNSFYSFILLALHFTWNYITHYP